MTGQAALQLKVLRPESGPDKVRFRPEADPS